MKVIIEVRKTDDKFGVYINGILIGTSKNQFDADHTKVILEREINGW